MRAIQIRDGQEMEDFYEEIRNAIGTSDAGIILDFEGVGREVAFDLVDEVRTVRKSDDPRMVELVAYPFGYKHRKGYRKPPSSGEPAEEYEPYLEALSQEATT